MRLKLCNKNICNKNHFLYQRKHKAKKNVSNAHRRSEMGVKTSRTRHWANILHLIMCNFFSYEWFA